MAKSITQGVIDYNPEGWVLSKNDKKRILAACGKTDGESLEFIRDIEAAVCKCLAHENLTVPRSEVLKEINNLAKTASKLLEHVRRLEELQAGYNFYSRIIGPYEMSFDVLKDWAYSINDISAIAQKSASVELSGRGDTQDERPALLASDIAKAFVRAGLKTSISRPSMNVKGETRASPFWKVSEICFRLSGIKVVDLYPHLKKGVEIDKQRRTGSDLI